jgi:hypothetical protein
VISGDCHRNVVPAGPPLELHAEHRAGPKYPAAGRAALAEISTGEDVMTRNRTMKGNVHIGAVDLGASPSDGTARTIPPQVRGGRGRRDSNPKPSDSQISAAGPARAGQVVAAGQRLSGPWLTNMDETENETD